jgi:hypothetical protein
MPYYIRKDAPGCAGWATTHADGSVMTCHKTRGDAIKHMVAVSIATKEKPGGTWGTKKESVIDQMMIEAAMAEAESGPEEWAMLNERQREQAKGYAELATEFGMFDQSSKANGAHYAPAAKNPFKPAGLMCGNCVFFDEANNQCQIVAGPIEPEAVCKLWVIPENLIKE